MSKTSEDKRIQKTPFKKALSHERKDSTIKTPQAKKEKYFHKNLMIRYWILIIG